MTTAKKTTGRPRRNADEVLGQLTIRMSSKLKFGLELLARLQGRSLSQAVEWALHHSLSNVVGGTFKHQLREDVASLNLPEDATNLTMLQVLDSVWGYTGWERTYALYNFNPFLVQFEERHACRLIAESEEESYLNQLLRSITNSDTAEYDALHAAWVRVMTWAWPRLIADERIMSIATAQAVRDRLPLCFDIGCYDGPVLPSQPLSELILIADRCVADMNSRGELSWPLSNEQDVPPR